MKTIKKILAAVLAIITAFSVAVIGNADSYELEGTVYYLQSQTDNRLYIKDSVDQEFFNSIVIYRIDENEERVEIKSFRKTDSGFDGIESKHSCTIISLGSENIFTVEGSYVIELTNTYEYEGTVHTDTYYTQFNYPDVILTKPAFMAYRETIEIDEEIDLYDYLIIPEGMEEEVALHYFENHLGDDDSRKFISIRSGKATGVNKGFATVYVENKHTSQFYDSISIRVNQKKADNIFELFSLTFESLAEGTVSGVKNILWSVASGIFGVFLPFFFAGGFIGGLIFNLFS